MRPVCIYGQGTPIQEPKWHSVAMLYMSELKICKYYVKPKCLKYIEAE